MERAGTSNDQPAGLFETTIIALIRDQRLADAEKMLFAFGGLDYAFLHGYESLERILKELPSEAHLHSEVFLGLYCELLSKQGRARRAKALLDDGAFTFSKSHLFDVIELSVAIRLSEQLTPEKIQRWINLEAHLPLDRPLTEGIYYNCMLIVFVRLNRIDEARSFGRRALESYGRAQKPYLQFFIHQILADLAVVAGELKKARRHLSAAASYLDEAGIAYGSDREILEIVQLAIDYETGKMAHIPERAREIRQGLVKSENTGEITVQICRIGAMSTFFLKGRAAAIAFLKESQIDYHRSQGEFSVALDVVLANINLLDGRAEEAQHMLEDAERQGVLSAIGTVVCETIHGKLAAQNALEKGLATNLNTRRRVVAELIQAELARIERRPTDMRKHVERAMRLAVNEGLVTVFLEHREVVAKVSSKLAKGGFARGHRQLARMARKIHRMVHQSYQLPDSMVDLGITTQQMRVLNALRKGATNKQIARTLGLSEAAIKYHVSKLLKMFHTSKRGELIERYEEKVDSF